MSKYNEMFWMALLLVGGSISFNMSVIVMALGDNRGYIGGFIALIAIIFIIIYVILLCIIIGYRGEDEELLREDEDIIKGLFVNIYGDPKIGKDVKIGSFVEIQPNVKIGNNVTISSHSFICSLVTIEDDVFIGHGIMTINDINPPSKKRTGSDKEWKPTLIKKGAVIGSGVTLFPVTIGVNAVVGAGSVVTKDVPDNCIVKGNPAK